MSEKESQAQIDVKTDEKALPEKPLTAAIEDDDVENDAPPSRPPRPVSAEQKLINQLHQAFPKIEEKYIKMALIASEGNLDPAFNALLFLSDPTSGIQIPKIKTKPPVPPKDVERKRQLESDEALARRLARQYEEGSGHRHHKQAPPKPTRKPQNWEGYDNYGKGSDSDEDIVDTISKNVEEARVKVGGWLGNIAKKLQETTINESSEPSQRNPNAGQHLSERQAAAATKRSHTNSGNGGQLFNAFGGGSSARNSLDYTRVKPSERYTTNRTNTTGSIRMSDNSSEDLYGTPTVTKTTPGAPVSAVAATASKPGVTTAIDPVTGKPLTAAIGDDSTAAAAGNAKSAGAGKGKWEPLASVNPEPVSDGTFLVDDSDDDDDVVVSKDKK
ncbi:unnamed protein product [Ambrosiozyma monospora]|uniref:Unnamed protein product n=1 Tax=Ambrosiozyma monospora TaxID=43982 RepID=A0A9W6YQV0_AMBMO|nr:unnamed protein product [Ambrosiozyma monospora]